MENTLVRTLNSALPQCSGNITYNDVAKMFCAPAYVAQSGNMYQEGLRISDRLAIKYSIGYGYCHVFMNGIQVYAYDGTKMKLVTQGSYYNFWWNEADINAETARLVQEYLKSETKVLGIQGISESELSRQAKSLVDQARKNTETIGTRAIAASGNKQLNA